MRKQSVRKQRMQLRQDRPNITKKEFHKIQGHRIFDLGSERMIILFSTDFCKRKCHVCVLNLNSSYIYISILIYNLDRFSFPIYFFE